MSTMEVDGNTLGKFKAGIHLDLFICKWCYPQFWFKNSLFSVSSQVVNPLVIGSFLWFVMVFETINKEFCLIFIFCQILDKLL